MPPLPPPPAERRPAQLPDGAAPHFALFGIPIRIGLGFWLLSFLLGFQQGRPIAEAVRQAIAVVAIVFVSVLVHEMGHALVARRFGAKPVILLHAFGGLTSYSAEGLSLGRWRRIAISLAGPFAGFALGALVFFATRHMALSPGQKWIVGWLLWANLGWGVVNLLPVLPLDGGNVLAAAMGPKRAFATAVISALFAGAVALYGGLALHSPFLVVLFGFAAVSAISQARAARAGDVDRRAGLEDQLMKAKAALARGDLDDAYILADDVVRRARTMPVRNGAWTALAWVHVERGEGALAREAIGHVEPRFAVDPYTLAAVEDAAGDAGRARAILEEARRRGVRIAPATKLLIDLLARDGRIEAAVDVAVEDAHLLEVADVRAIYHASLDAGAPRAAARLAARLFELHEQAADAVDEARALATAGDVAGALAALTHALRIGPVDRAALLADPAFAPLAEDERFQQLLG